MEVGRYEDTDGLRAEQYFHLSVLESGKTRIVPAAVENGIKNQVELIEEHRAAVCCFEEMKK